MQQPEAASSSHSQKKSCSLHAPNVFLPLNQRASSERVSFREETRFFRCELMSYYCAILHKELIFFAFILALSKCLFSSLRCLVLHPLHANPALWCSLLPGREGDGSPTPIVLMSKLEWRRFETLLVFSVKIKIVWKLRLLQRSSRDQDFCTGSLKRCGLRIE